MVKTYRHLAALCWLAYAQYEHAKYYILVILCALMACMIYTPSALRPAAQAFGVCIRQATCAHSTTNTYIAV